MLSSKKKQARQKKKKKAASSREVMPLLGTHHQDRSSSDFAPVAAAAGTAAASAALTFELHPAASHAESLSHCSSSATSSLRGSASVVGGGGGGGSSSSCSLDGAEENGLASSFMIQQQIQQYTTRPRGSQAGSVRRRRFFAAPHQSLPNQQPHPTAQSSSHSSSRKRGMDTRMLPIPVETVPVAPAWSAPLSQHALPLTRATTTTATATTTTAATSKTRHATNAPPSLQNRLEKDAHKANQKMAVSAVSAPLPTDQSSTVTPDSSSASSSGSASLSSHSAPSPNETHAQKNQKQPQPPSPWTGTGVGCLTPTTPHARPLLPENDRDTTKKARPFPVPVRRRPLSRPMAKDPPEGGGGQQPEPTGAGQEPSPPPPPPQQQQQRSHLQSVHPHRPANAVAVSAKDAARQRLNTIMVQKPPTRNGRDDHDDDEKKIDDLSYHDEQDAYQERQPAIIMTGREGQEEEEEDDNGDQQSSSLLFMEQLEEDEEEYRLDETNAPSNRHQGQNHSSLFSLGSSKSSSSSCGVSSSSSSSLGKLLDDDNVIHPNGAVPTAGAALLAAKSSSTTTTTTTTSESGKKGHKPKHSRRSASQGTTGNNSTALDSLSLSHSRSTTAGSRGKNTTAAVGPGRTATKSNDSDQTTQTTASDQHSTQSTQPSFTQESQEDSLLQPSMHPTAAHVATDHHSASSNASDVSVPMTRALLSRPFGRHGLPTEVARKWVAEVSPPEWTSNQWFYRVMVQGRKKRLRGTNATTATQPSHQQHHQMHHAVDLPASSSNEFAAFQSQQQSGSFYEGMRQSFTTAFTWRTLSDFYWLEHCLKQEFHGGLLLPDLRLAIQDVSSRKPVPAEPLKIWLNDVLNGIRGEGEWIVEYGSEKSPFGSNSMDEAENLNDSLMNSEAMESFLYKTGPLGVNTNQTAQGDETGLDCHIGENGTLLHQLFLKPLLWVDLCVGPAPYEEDGEEDIRNDDCSVVAGQDVKGPQRERPPLGSGSGMRRGAAMSKTRDGIGGRFRLDVMTCSSRALGTAPSLDIQDSFAAPQLSPTPSSSAIALHSELLEAQEDLLQNYSRTTLVVLTKLQLLKEEEDILGQNWKRFAIAMSNLFGYEKDVESAKLGDMKVKKENIPYFNVNKQFVDDGLKGLAKYKMERSLPGLNALHSMLRAYSTDLAVVGPSVDAFRHAMQKLDVLKEETKVAQHFSKYGYYPNGDGRNKKGRVGSNHNRDARGDPSVSWDKRIQTLADDVRNRAIGSLASSAHERRKAAAEAAAALQRQEVFEQSMLRNERMLQHSMSALCRVVPVRVARMAWRYWSTESVQCTMVKRSAAFLKAKVDLASKDTVSKMIKRHLKEEKEDNVVEMDLVHRIVNIRQVKKFNHSSGGDVSSVIDEESQVEVEDGSMTSHERARGVRRGRALDMARERVGRWDSKLALAILEAIEIDDPNVRMEETTRDLRLVRKYAIGLREHLNRCIEAIQLLRPAYSKRADQQESQQTLRDGHKRTSIASKRKELLVELAKLFSGRPVKGDKNAPRRSRNSTSVLTGSGVDLTDSLGWLDALKASDDPPTPSEVRISSVGELAMAYHNSRDTQTDWLLKSIYDLLMDYFERVEVIESYVFMEAVGIQLEKHFNQKRTEALTAFEKKTDITSALNVAKRKRLGKLVKDLQAKLDAIPPDVSHTLVKETKEMHLESKNLKAELHSLAVRRLTRSRETSTERVVAMISLWAKEEEAAATSELKAVGDAMAALERAMEKESVEALMYRIPGEGSGLSSL